MAPKKKAQQQLAVMGAMPDVAAQPRLKKTTPAEADAEERQLEGLVFGLQSEVVAQLQRPDSPDTLSDAEADDMFQLDRRGETEPSEETGEPTPGEEAETDAARRPAWTDEDDQRVTVPQAAATFAGERSRGRGADGPSYRAALERRFAAVVGAPEWARLDRKRRRDSDDETAGDLLTTTGHLLAEDARGGALLKGSLLTKKSADLTSALAERPKTVTALQFHPRSQVALVGGVRGGGATLALMQVDGVENPLVQMVPLPAGFRVQTAHFSADGGRVLAGSERAGHLQCYDMMTGRSWRLEACRRLGLRSVPDFSVSPDGQWLAVPAPRAGSVHLLSARSHEWVHTLQASGRVTALTFAPDGSRLFTHSDEGVVYEWDMASRACVHRFTDQGCLAGSALAVSADGRLLAAGSSSGVVNLYETASARRLEHPEPVKILDHLTTGCTRLLFNATSELLAMASAEKEHAVKLVHVPSRTVFSNFPGWSQAVHEPHQLDFSPHSGYLAVGNNKSRALLYRLQHYHSY